MVNIYIITKNKVNPKVFKNFGVYFMRHLFLIISLFRLQRLLRQL